MTDTYSKLTQNDLDIADANPTIVAGPYAERTIVKHIRIVNQSTTAIAAAKMWQRTSAGVPVNDELILPAADISAGGWAEFEGTIIMEPNEYLYADTVTPTSGAGASLTITVYGLRMA